MPERYIKFSKAYRRLRDLQTQQLCGRPTDDLRDDPMGQMLLMTTLLHERAGTNRAYARYHAEALRQVVHERGAPYEQLVLDDGDLPEAVWQAFEDLVEGGVNPGHAEGPVAGTLRLLHQRGTANWVKLFGQTSPSNAWATLDELQGIGPKLSGLTLREFQVFLTPWAEVQPAEWFCFMPVDRWVLRAAKLLWPEDDWPADPPSGARDYQLVAGRAAAKFRDLPVAMDFNMGAWFLNAMRSEVLALHGVLFVGEWQDDALHGIAPQLDANRVAEALTMDLVLP